MVISLRVRVPVLSVQITDADPSASTELSFFTMAWRVAIRCTPIASTTDRIAGRRSGAAATASETPSSSTTTRSRGVLTPLTRMIVSMTTIAITVTMSPSILPRRLSSVCKGVGSSTVASSIRASTPISVFMPVAVTIARPTPWAIAVPISTMLRRSPGETTSGRVSGCFVTASLSPVREASAIRNPLAERSRASAPTASHSDRARISPHTSSADGTVTSSPPRSAVLEVVVMAPRAATASSARASCTYPRIH